MCYFILFLKIRIKLKNLTEIPSEARVLDVLSAKSKFQKRKYYNNTKENIMSMVERETNKEDLRDIKPVPMINCPSTTLSIENKNDTKNGLKYRIS